MLNYISPMLMCDFYKTVHSDMLNPEMTFSMSYYTPRMSRVKRWNKVVNFGLQMFIKTYLIDYFNTYFFERPVNEVVEEFERVLDNTLGKGESIVKYRRGVALETQFYPDALNHDNFPFVYIEPNKEFKTTTEFRFSIA